MQNKSILKGGVIFIEHDLTWEERKVQEKIDRWVRAERDKGGLVKAGYAKVRIDSQWVRWEKVEQGMVQEKEREVRGKGIGGHRGKRGSEEGAKEEERAVFRS